MKINENGFNLPKNCKHLFEVVENNLFDVEGLLNYYYKNVFPEAKNNKPCEEFVFEILNNAARDSISSDVFYSAKFATIVASNMPRLTEDEAFSFVVEPDFLKEPLVDLVFKEDDYENEREYVNTDYDKDLNVFNKENQMKHRDAEKVDRINEKLRKNSYQGGKHHNKNKPNRNRGTVYLVNTSEMKHTKNDYKNHQNEHSGRRVKRDYQYNERNVHKRPQNRNDNVREEFDQEM